MAFFSQEISRYSACLLVKNVLYLTPLAKRFIYADVLPFSDEKKMNQPYPIYCIQGNITEKRRNYTLLENILNKI